MSPNKNLIVIIGFLIIWQSCKQDSAPDNPVVFDDTPYNLNIGDFPAPLIASDNQLTQQGVQLGRMLFYDKKLSKDGSISCGSCHRQENAFSDTNQFSLGVNSSLGKRQAMATFNMAWNYNGFFWDGRAHLLRDQSLMPIQDSLEMAETLGSVISKLQSDQKYNDQFIRAFGSSEITSVKMSLALEQFMNSITSVDSKYDQFLRGEKQLSASEERGRVLFFKEYDQINPDSSGAGCAHCHIPDNFENNDYLNNGMDAPASQNDIGREKVTGLPKDRAKMKVTSLRNIEMTYPYMHDGRFKTLEEVVNHYNSGLKNSPTLDPFLQKTMSTGLRLDSQDKLDLINFLKTLTDNVLLTKEEYSDPF